MIASSVTVVMFGSPLSILVTKVFRLIPTGNYMFKIINRNTRTRTRYELC